MCTKNPQNTDRIDRKAAKARICRHFMRSMLLMVIARILVFIDRRAYGSTVSSLSPLASSQDRKDR